MQVRIHNIVTNQYFGCRAGQNKIMTWSYDGLNLSFRYSIGGSGSNAVYFRASQSSTKYKLLILQTQTISSNAGAVPTVTPTTVTPTSSENEVAPSSDYPWGVFFLVVPV